MKEAKITDLLKFYQNPKKYAILIYSLDSDTCLGILDWNEHDNWGIRNSTKWISGYDNLLELLYDKVFSQCTNFIIKYEEI